MTTKTMKKLSYKKIFAVAAIAVIVFVFLPISTFTPSPQKALLSSALSSPQKSLPSLSFSPRINFAEATDTTQTVAGQQLASDPFSCSWTSNGIATCSMYLAAMAVVWVLKFFIALGALLVQIGLQKNKNLYNSPTVTTGFSVSLAIANLGFVLGIIIIALATILRNQTYGAKQILWKLVVMAIFVNFGLVITRPIVGVADGITTYFMGQVSGASGDASAFTANLVNAFSPQTLSEPIIINPADITKDYICAAQVPGGTYIACQIAGSLVNFFTTNKSEIFVRTFLACIFAIVLAALIAFTLIALAVLLLVRYVYLGILLVLLPFAWLMWIFPKFSSEFSKWWNNFIQWTFFPTCALFFIYLTLATITSTAYKNSALQVASTTTDSSKQAMGGLFEMTGLIGMIQQFADEFVLAGLLIGGLVASQALTGKAGGIVVGGGKAAAGWVGKKAGGYASKQAQKGARAAYRGVGGEKLTQGLQTSRIRPLAALGRGISSVSTNEKMVEDAKKSVPNSPEEIKRNLEGSMSTEKQLAHISKLIEGGNMKGDEKVNGVNIKDFMDSHGDEIKLYGQGKIIGDADKTPGSSKAMRDAEKELLALPVAARSTSDAMRKMTAATREFLDGLSKADMSKMNVNSVFGGANGNSELSKALAKGLLTVAPHLTASLMPKMKSDALNKFANNYRGAGLEEYDRLSVNATGLSNDQMNRETEKIEKRMEAFEKIFANNEMSGDVTTPAAAAATPPPTPGTPHQ
jgi:hypothetical protein